MTDAVDAALGDAFPDRTVVETTVPESADHPGNDTVLVRFADGSRAYLKVATDGDATRIRRDAAVCRYVRAHGTVRAPKVLATGGGERPFAATAPLSGTPLAALPDPGTDEVRAERVRTVGKTLARLHETPVDGPGRIVGGDADGLRYAETDWPGALRATLRERTAMHFADRFDGAPDRVDALLADAAETLSGFEPALCHEDPNAGNLFVADGRPPGMVDWETAVVGDPALSLARGESHHVDVVDADEELRSRLRAALYGGYRAVADDLPTGYEERRPIYRVVTFLLTAQTFDLWAPEAAEPTPELAAWVEREFADRLSTARRRL